MDAKFTSWNFDSVPSSDLLGDFNDLGHLGGEPFDSHPNLAIDTDAFGGLGIPLPPDFELLFPDPTVDLPLASLGEPGLATASICAELLRSQHDVNDHFDPGLLNVDPSLVWSTWLPPSDDDLVKMGEDASSFLPDVHIVSTTQFGHADFAYGSIPEAYNYDSTPQAAQQIPMEALDMYKEPPLLLKRRRQSPEAIESDREAKMARTNIPSSAKQTLMQAFRIDHI